MKATILGLYFEAISRFHKVVVQLFQACIDFNSSEVWKDLKTSINSNEKRKDLADMKYVWLPLGH